MLGDYLYQNKPYDSFLAARVPLRSTSDLDRTLTETQTNRDSSRTIDQGGNMTDGSHGEKELPESLTRKFKDLEKRVMKMLDNERKRREKQETEKDRGLQKKLVTMEAEINR